MSWIAPRSNVLIAERSATMRQLIIERSLAAVFVTPAIEALGPRSVKHESHYRSDLRALSRGHCIAPQAARTLQSIPQKITIPIIRLGQAKPLKGCPLSSDGRVANAAEPTPIPIPRNNCQPFSKVKSQTSRDLVNPIARIAASSARRSMALRNCETPRPIVPSSRPNAPKTWNAPK